MGFNVVQFFENFFGFGQKPTTTPATPSQFQGALNTAGGVMDQFEAGINTLQAASAFLPAPFQGYIAAIAVAVHSADGFLDTLESPSTGTPPPTQQTSAPPAATVTPLPSPPANPA